MCGEGPKGIPRRDRAFNAKCGGRGLPARFPRRDREGTLGPEDDKYLRRGGGQGAEQPGCGGAGGFVRKNRP
jgi:hypothetical protein